MRQRYFIPMFLAGLFLGLAVNGKAFELVQGGVQGGVVPGTRNIVTGSGMKEIHLNTGAAFQRQLQDLQTLLDRIHLLTREGLQPAKSMKSREGFRELAVRWVVSGPSEQQDRERELIMAVIRHLQAVKAIYPGDHQYNVRLFSELVGIISGQNGVEIADPAFERPYGALAVPAQFLQPGHRGVLGAVLDVLQDSDYVVRPQVKQWFERPAWLRWFNSSV